MSKPLVEIEGFSQLVLLVKKLPDKVKKKELAKILGQVANPVLNEMRKQVPIGSGFIDIYDSNEFKTTYKRKKRQAGKFIKLLNPNGLPDYKPGLGRSSLAKSVMRRTSNAVVVVGPRSRKGKDGWYLRQFIIKGTKNIKANPFVHRTYLITANRANTDAEVKITRYIELQIDRLSYAKQINRL